MDPSLQINNDNGIPPLSTPSSSSRKRERERENETPSQRHKRVMAAERQRRKRERDRNNSLNHNGSISSIGKTNGHPTPVFSSPNQQLPVSAPPPPDSNRDEDDLSPEEKARRERVRAAARERQRKHRALVKDRKMRELGLDMGNEITDVHYSRDGQYLMPHELDQQHHHELDQQQHEEIVQPEPPYPQGQPLGGQTFASTLLLSFSCAPLLKQHLLRNLQMTNEELASLEPVIAEAWDRWDHQRRLHYAQQAAAADEAAKGAGPSSASAHAYAPAEHMSMPNGSVSNAMGYPTGSEHAHDAAAFRTRFQRSLVAPSPFRTVDTQTTTPNTPSSTMSATASNASNASGPPSDNLSDLGQARGEAEGVVGRLEGLGGR